MVGIHKKQWWTNPLKQNLIHQMVRQTNINKQRVAPQFKSEIIHKSGQKFYVKKPKKK